MAFRASTAALAMIAGVAVSGCDYLPFGYTSIGEIAAAPGQFEGKEVKLKGRVKSVVKLLGVKAFSLQDETGDIIVVTDGQLPAESSDVAVKGIVRSAVIIGGTSLGLKVDETKRLR
ncbi:MAG TPA: hypothetical protein VKF40_06025 [Burkholderiales bacterium]|nr:hypothetical protein [Burkholderiales bacterium]